MHSHPAAPRPSLTAQLGRMSRAQLRSVLSDDPANALVWIQNLAREGVPAAQVLYASMLLEGTAVPKDQAAAVSWFTKAAHQNDPDGLNMLGRCLEHGWGCRIDLEGSAKCFRLAAEQGHSWALYNLAHRYLDGLGVKRDLGAAFAYYMQSAEQGHPRAMNLLGRCFEEGWGVAADSMQAGSCYRRSAEAGYFRGQFNWASYLLGEDRIEEAASWFHLACQNSNAGIKTAVLEVLKTRSEAIFEPLRRELCEAAGTVPTLRC